MKENLYRRIFENNSFEAWDINLIYAGHQKTSPGFDSGVHCIEDNTYILHYIVQGKGVFKFNECEVGLKKFDLFLLYPGEKYYYTADTKVPWEYISFRFSLGGGDGFLRKLKFTKEHPYAIQDTDLGPYVESILKNCGSTLSGRLIRMGKFYEFLAQLADNFSDVADRRYAAATEYIHLHYREKIKISDLASYLGITRDYLYKIFKMNSGMSPQNFILMRRLSESRYLLQSGMTAAEVSNELGFCDQYYFSSIFKKYFGMSPSRFKRLY